MSGELRLFLTAVQFFTRIPVPAWVGHSAQQLDGASRYFPLVGLLLGGGAVTVLLLTCAPLGSLVAAILATLFTVLLTGAFHEDGLADSADGLYGGWTREDRLRIMKDSRIGTFGAIALVLILALKITLLARLPCALAACALMIGHSQSRWCVLLVMRTLKYVREDLDSRAKPLATHISTAALLAAGLLGPALAIAAVITVAGHSAWLDVSLRVVTLAIAASFVMSVAGMLLVRATLRGKLGGYTGDGLGATQQISEVCGYLGFALVCALS